MLMLRFRDPITIRPLLLNHAKLPLQQILEIFYDLCLDMKTFSIAESHGFISDAVDLELAEEMGASLTSDNIAPIIRLRRNW